jgi:hypothetical protein
MNYEVLFAALCAFIAGRIFPRSIYIGHDKKKYDRADAGILLSPPKK